MWSNENRILALVMLFTHERTNKTTWKKKDWISFLACVDLSLSIASAVSHTTSCQELWYPFAI